MMRSVSPLLLLLFIGLLSAAAAGEPSAKELWERGMVLYDLRKFDEAIRQFEQAYEKSPQPAFLYNIAQAHRQAGRPAEAIAFYKNYLRRLPKAPNREEVEAWIASLEKLPQRPATPAPETPKEPPLRPLPPPAPYPEPRSGHSFPTILTEREVPYILTGVGARSYMGFLIYGVGLYVEADPARRAYPRLVQQAGGTELSQLTSLDLAQSFIVMGEFGKLAVMHFARNVSAKSIRDSYRDMLKDNLKDATPAALRDQTEKFVALFQRDMKAGEELRLHTTARGEISVTAGGQRLTGPTSPRLVLDLWNCWLGKRPVSQDLKQSLVRRITALGQ
jgi:tetratricopeptide (TPR) repeat protein